jgi:phosphatidate cytidylyltransferase
MIELQKRLLTAGCAIPLIVLLVFYASSLILLAILFLAFVMASVEWGQLTQKGYYSIFYVFLSVFLWSVALFFLPWSVMGYVSLVFSISAFVLVLAYQYHRFQYAQRSIYAVLGVVYLVPAFLSLAWLGEHSRSFLMWLLAAVWLADSAAYGAGRLWGSKPLASLISPNKTITGMIGAVIVVWLMILMSIAMNWLPSVMHKVNWIWLAGLPFLVVIGDLFESMVKRIFGQKDSGRLLPGHGGFLDRLDGLCYAAPIMYLWYDFFVYVG